MAAHRLYPPCSDRAQHRRATVQTTLEEQGNGTAAVKVKTVFFFSIQSSIRVQCSTAPPMVHATTAATVWMHPEILLRDGAVQAPSRYEVVMES